MNQNGDMFRILWNSVRVPCFGSFVSQEFKVTRQTDKGRGHEP
jgi:hypothetical protein